MGKNKTKLEQIQRELDRRAPAEPIVIRFVWRDEATGEEEEWGRMVVGDEQTRTIDLKWPEDEDDERKARQVAPGRA